MQYTVLTLETNKRTYRELSYYLQGKAHCLLVKEVTKCTTLNRIRDHSEFEKELVLVLVNSVKSDLPPESRNDSSS